MNRPVPSQQEDLTTVVINQPSARVSRFLFRIPARILLGLIWTYQRTLSPTLPIVFGPSFGCRFAPSCSHYAAEAVRTHGALLGAFLAVRRLVKCTPLHPGGMDPVPPRRPRCHRIERAVPTEITSSHLTV